MKKLFSASMLVVMLIVAMAVPASAAGKAMVRVMHASPDAPAVDVYVNGAPAFTNLEFPQATAYAALDEGTYAVKVFASAAKGTGKAAIDAPSLALAAKPYTVIAVGKLAEIKPIVLEDNLAKPAAGKAHIRFVHASPDAPAVDITLKDGTKIFSNIAFGKASDFTPVNAGTYDLQARAAGTATVALDVPGVKLEDGKIYMVVATGLLNGTPKLGVNVVTYEPMASALPATGAETNNSMVVWQLAVAGIIALSLGLGLRGASVNNR